METKYILTKNREILIINLVDEASLIIISRGVNEKIYAVKTNIIQDLGDILEKKPIWIFHFLRSLVYNGYKNLRDILEEDENSIFLYSIRKEDPLLIQILKKIIPDYNPKEPILKQYILYHIKHNKK